MSLRSKLSVLAVALSLAVPALATAQDLKIGYVDYQRVLLEVSDGKAAKARLQKWLEARQKEIDSQQEALRKEKETLDKQASAMSEETRIQKATELQKKVYDLAQKWERSRGIAQREGLGLVFEKRDSGLVYAMSQYDLTNEVIRTYNSSAGKAKDAPVAKDAPKK
jgi:outer membrane protein